MEKMILIPYSEYQSMRNNYEYMEKRYNVMQTQFSENSICITKKQAQMLEAFALQFLPTMKKSIIGQEFSITIPIESAKEIEGILEKDWLDMQYQYEQKIIDLEQNLAHQSKQIHRLKSLLENTPHVKKTSWIDYFYKKKSR
jgi:hypothetical protein